MYVDYLCPLLFFLYHLQLSVILRSLTPLNTLGVHLADFQRFPVSRGTARVRICTFPELKLFQRII